MQRLLRTLLNSFILPEPNISCPCFSRREGNSPHSPIISWFTLKFTAIAINNLNYFNLSHQRLLKMWQVKRKAPTRWHLVLEENGKARRFIWSSRTCEPHTEMTWKHIVFQSALNFVFIGRHQSNFYNKPVIIQSYYICCVCRRSQIVSEKLFPLCSCSAWFCSATRLRT